MLDRALLDKINADSYLLGALYDLNLLPEQVNGEEQEKQLALVVAVYFTGREAERKFDNHRREIAESILQTVADVQPSFEDERIKYVELQIDREDWLEARKFHQTARKPLNVCRYCCTTVWDDEERAANTDGIFWHPKCKTMDDLRKATARSKSLSKAFDEAIEGIERMRRDMARHSDTLPDVPEEMLAAYDICAAHVRTLKNRVDG